MNTLKKLVGGPEKTAVCRLEVLISTSSGRLFLDFSTSSGIAVSCRFSSFEVSFEVLKQFTWRCENI